MCEKKGGLGGKLGGFAVAPYAGAWIEIYILDTLRLLIQVAPYAGAWIEIAMPEEDAIKEATSLPTRERGLK